METANNPHEQLIAELMACIMERVEGDYNRSNTLIAQLHRLQFHKQARWSKSRMRAIGRLRLEYALQSKPQEYDIDIDSSIDIIPGSPESAEAEILDRELGRIEAKYAEEALPDEGDGERDIHLGWQPSMISKPLEKGSIFSEHIPVHYFEELDELVREEEQLKLTSSDESELDQELQDRLLQCIKGFMGINDQDDWELFGALCELRERNQEDQSLELINAINQAESYHWWLRDNNMYIEPSVANKRRTKNVGAVASDEVFALAEEVRTQLTTIEQQWLGERLPYLKGRFKYTVIRKKLYQISSDVYWLLWNLLTGDEIQDTDLIMSEFYSYPGRQIEYDPIRRAITDLYKKLVARTRTNRDEDSHIKAYFDPNAQYPELRNANGDVDFIRACYIVNKYFPDKKTKKVGRCDQGYYYVSQYNEESRSSSLISVNKSNGKHLTVTWQLEWETTKYVAALSVQDVRDLEEEVIATGMCRRDGQGRVVTNSGDSYLTIVDGNSEWVSLTDCSEYDHANKSKRPIRPIVESVGYFVGDGSGKFIERVSSVGFSGYGPPWSKTHDPTKHPRNRNMPSDDFLPEWAYCIIGTISDAGSMGAQGRRYEGTKHFDPCAEVYYMDAFWGAGGERVTVMGVPRYGPDFIKIVMKCKNIESFRVEKTREKAVVRELYLPFGEADLQSDEYRDSLLELVGYLNANTRGVSVEQ